MSGPTPGLPLGGVLVGGRSRRFGSDKAAAHVGGRSMADLAVRALRRVCDPVVLLGGDGTLARRMALPSREDARPGCGPLAGVATGLAWALELNRPGLFVLACDLPLVTPALMEEIADAAGPEVDVVLPRARPGDVQPLCAWYGVSSLPSVEDCLERGEYSMLDLLSRLSVRYVTDGHDSRAPGSPLLNVNTPEQLTTAQRWMAGER